MNTPPRKPRAVRLDQATSPKPDVSAAKPEPASRNGTQRKPRSQNNLAQVTMISDDAAQAPASLDNDDLAASLTPPPGHCTNKRFSFFKVMMFALAGLVSLGFGLMIDQLIAEFVCPEHLAGMVGECLDIVGCCRRDWYYWA